LTPERSKMQQDLLALSCFSLLPAIINSGTTQKLARFVGSILLFSSSGHH